MAAGGTASGSRYVIRDILGQGGMGVVYRAYDSETRRDVTMKTLLDPGNPALLDLFRKECDVLSQINHPNIVDIYDVGTLEDGGVRKPYFVMPMLLGVTLDKLIAEGSHRLSVERTVDIVSQICRGLHAAHERGLVHRDIKPSNIFVLDDDSVKIIDFGVAHLSSGSAQTSVKGTLHYMAPEQLRMERPTGASDQFSVAVLMYETLTRRKPFNGSTMDEVVQVIVNLIPPPASEFNPGVNRQLAQVIHKAMAKQPAQRFGSARDLAEALRKALNGETLEIFDEAKMQSRMERARRALDSGDLEFAGEVVSGLEGEGYIHPDMGPLRRQIDQVGRERAVRQLIESARRYLREEEYQLAQQKVVEALKVDPNNGEAMSLQSDIQSHRSTEQIAKWMRLAEEHLANHGYGHARRALEDVLQLDPDDATARKMLADLNVRERDYLRARKEKDELYESAMAAWRRGEITSALDGIERVIELDKKAPDAADPERGASYQRFYNQVRSDHDAARQGYEEAQRLKEQRNFKQALAVCDQALRKYPEHALFKSLKVDIEEAQRQDLSAFIARIDREVEAEVDLDRRVSMIRQAMASAPGEPHFESILRLTTAKRDLVNSIVTKARNAEERRQFGEALNQWEMLRTIYAGYPGIEFEVERLKKRRDQQVRAEAKSRWVEQVDGSLAAGEWQRAQELAGSALAEFPDDPELEAMLKLGEQGAQRVAEAQVLLEDGRALVDAGQFNEAAAALRRALTLDEKEPRIRTALIDGLLRGARATSESEPEAAEGFVRQALELDPKNSTARSLRTLLEDKRRDREVDECLAKVRQTQLQGDIDAALEVLRAGLVKYPQDQRLLQLRGSLERVYPSQTQALRDRDLEAAKRLESEAGSASGTEELQTLLHRSQTLAEVHSGDQAFETVVESLRQKVAAAQVSATIPEMTVPEIAQDSGTVTSFLPSEALAAGIVASTPEAEAPTQWLEEPLTPATAPDPVPAEAAAPSESPEPPVPVVTPAPVEAKPAETKRRGGIPAWVIAAGIVAVLLIGGALGVASRMIPKEETPVASQPAEAPAAAVPDPAPVPPSSPTAAPEPPAPAPTGVAPNPDAAKPATRPETVAEAKPAAQAPAPPKPPTPDAPKPPAAGWEPAGIWQDQGGAQVLKKGGTAIYTQRGSVYEAQVSCKGGLMGGCGIAFFVNFRSGTEHVRVALDKKNVIIRQIRDGRLTVDPTRTPHGVRVAGNVYQVRFEVRPSRITVSMIDGGAWKTVGEIDGAQLNGGRFGIIAEADTTLLALKTSR